MTIDLPSTTRTRAVKKSQVYYVDIPKESPYGPRPSVRCSGERTMLYT